MPKLPFTKQGMQLKLQQLYALNDAQLSVAAREISDNLASWLDNNFNLSPDQQTYLSTMPSRVVDAIGYELGSVVILRGQVFPPEPQSYPPAQRTKQVKTKKKGSCHYWPKPGGGYELVCDVSLEIEFLYVPV